MSEITLPYGERGLRWSPREKNVRIYSCAPAPAITDVEGAVRDSLRKPIGTEPLREIVRPADRVAVIVSDAARLFPQERFLRTVLAEISHADPARVTIVIANGSHTLSDPERIGLTRDIRARFAVVNHDARDNDSMRIVGRLPGKERLFFFAQALRHLVRSFSSLPGDLRRVASALCRGDAAGAADCAGYTMFGRALFIFGASFRTKVRINRAAADADIRILIGQIKPHFLAGFSGGLKAVFPGCARRRDIAKNHFMMNHPTAALGRNENNLLREYIERAGALCGRSFAVNAVMNPDKTLAGVFSGDPVAAQRRGSELCRRIADVEAEPADIVVSAEGLPEAVNLYQLTKVVPPAGRLVRPGGAIICVGECCFGVGGTMVVNEITCRIGFWHLLPPGVRLYLVSGLDRSTVEKTAFTYALTIDDAIAQEKKRRGRDGLSVAVLSGAGLMMPRCKAEG
ncbi:MAG TPA: lactate racemase domain-containing protein [bacterium]|nr:lactate racemase domain-containing protein [bacterium]